MNAEEWQKNEEKKLNNWQLSLYRSANRALRIYRKRKKEEETDQSKN